MTPGYIIDNQCFPVAGNQAAIAFIHHAGLQVQYLDATHSIYTDWFYNTDINVQSEQYILDNTGTFVSQVSLGVPYNLSDVAPSCDVDQYVFSINNLDAASLAGAFGSGFSIVALLLATIVGVRAVLSMLK